jgi:hypothetical protein
MVTDWYNFNKHHTLNHDRVQQDIVRVQQDMLLLTLGMVFPFCKFPWFKVSCTGSTLQCRKCIIAFVVAFYSRNTKETSQYS